MKLIRFAAPALVLAAFGAGKAHAQSSNTQDVTLEVQAINQIAFTGSPSLVISSAATGGALNSATANATYAITTNETGRKVTAQLDSDTPPGVTLSVNLAAPSLGTSAGTVQLGTSAQDVLTNVGRTSVSGLGLTYTLSAAASAGVVAATTRTVTYTIVAGA
ncbi:hypothetical protein [Longimicrobium sp.]|uniref:hypothetical protein n=1 Tax=Longimicrobium sp. TaxID=2029185 RepID=UPI002B7E27B6|nr:hypothetical protein [Longimicrobium sp.]HSU15181.1 hypothetical protein [Longimicrobium sp.]